MTCAEVQLLLSEYIETSLDTIRLKAVESHLLACPGCRAETEGLMDCIRQISDLPLLDPPIGFTQRVMAHVREIETRPSWWRRVLAPVRVSVPIQATALVLVAVLAVFLYQKESQISGNGASRAIPQLCRRHYLITAPAPNSRNRQHRRSAVPIFLGRRILKPVRFRHRTRNPAKKRQGLRSQSKPNRKRHHPQMSKQTALAILKILFPGAVRSKLRKSPPEWKVYAQAVTALDLVRRSAVRFARAFFSLNDFYRPSPSPARMPNSS